MGSRILVVEDERDIAELIRMQLKDQGYTVRIAGDGIAGLAEAESGNFDLVILDLMLPGMDGLEVCRRIRARSRYLPVLILTSKSSEPDRVLGLELGADDYLTKPFSVMELAARVKAIFRRMSAMDETRRVDSKSLVFGTLAIDPVTRRVSLAERWVDLTAKEFDLLFHFASNPGRVFTRAQLLDQVWGYTHSGYEHTVNSHINRLRAKIERDPAQPEFVLTVWGVGYKFGGTPT